MAPILSVIIPCRNEKNYIGQCLDSLITQTLAHQHYELIIVDGNSNDGTRQMIKEYEKKYLPVNYLFNPQAITPIALNLGLKKAAGQYIIIFGAHSYAQSDFLEKNLQTIKESTADCVGGVITTIGSNSRARAISLAMSSPFGVGNALFRFSQKTRYVDTVAFGCYRKELFKRIGYFDESLVRNQDAELNYRLVKDGGRILLNPEIKSYYYSRTTLKKLASQYFQYGFWKIKVLKKHKSPSSLRQLVPAGFLLSLLLCFSLGFWQSFFHIILFCILTLYLLANLLISSRIAINQGKKLFLAVFLSFILLHFSYGLGFISGFFYFIMLKKRVRNK